MHVAMQSDLEFIDKQDVARIAKTLIANKNSLDVHAEYNYNLPNALKKMEELKVSEPKVYNTITVGDSFPF